MNANRDVYGWRLLYFDGFAGSGTRNSEEDALEIRQAETLFGQHLTTDELNLYQGAAERVVRIEGDGIRSFDYYYFVDINEANCNALKEKLSAYQTTGKRHHLHLDANEAVQRLAGTLRNYSNCKALAFLDPFGMQINWSSIKALKDLSVDLWILVPTGVIINRLLKRKISSLEGLPHADRLTGFFGMTEEDIRSYFYTEKHEPTLFDIEPVITKEENAIRKIAQLYVDRLKSIFPYVTSEPMVLYNSNNVPIYHLVFAAKNGTAMKIAQDIIDKK